MMHEREFDKLIDSVRWMKRDQAGKRPKGGRRTRVTGVDVRAIRSATQLSQAKFAELLAIEVATLRNWEQCRREPTGPARALLRATRNDPVAVIKALRIDAGQ
jgi:putative transcriptional regulator